MELSRLLVAHLDRHIGRAGSRPLAPHALQHRRDRIAGGHYLEFATG